MSSIGLPGLNNFVGEFLVILGTFTRPTGLRAHRDRGGDLGAIYMLWSYQRTFQGPGEGTLGLAHRSVLARGSVIVAPIIVVMLVIGLHPSPVLDRMRPTAEQVAENVRSVQVGEPVEQVDADHDRRCAVIPTPELDFLPILPLLILVGGALITLVAVPFARRGAQTPFVVLTLVVLAAAAGSALWLWDREPSARHGRHGDHGPPGAGGDDRPVRRGRVRRVPAGSTTSSRTSSDATSSTRCCCSP